MNASGSTEDKTSAHALLSPDGRLRTGLRLDSALRALSVAFMTWVPGWLWLAALPGLYLWALTHPGALGAFVDANHISDASRRLLLMRVLGSELLCSALFGLVLWRRWVAAGAFNNALGLALVRDFAFLAAPLSLLPALVPTFPTAHPWLTLSAAMMGAAAMALSGPFLGELGRRVLSPLRRRPTLRRVLLILALGLPSLTYIAWVVYLQTVQHMGFRTGSYDIGIYTNILWQSYQGHWLACSFIKAGTHLSAHFDPILVALSPSMYFHPGPPTLYVIQATWLGSATLPIYLLGARRGGSAFALMLAVVYLLHPALHGVNLFDFHSLSLSLPFVLWAIYFLETGRLRSYVLTLLLLLSCREDMSIVASCIGLYAIVVCRQARLGVATIVVGAAYLLVIKFGLMADPALLMEDSEQTYEYGSYFAGLLPRGGGPLGALSTFLANPLFLMGYVLREDRLLYLVQLGAPLLFLPLLAGRRWVLLGYGLMLALLSSRSSVFTVGLHYAATLLPGLFALTPPAAEALAERLHRGFGIDRRRTWNALTAAMLMAGLSTSLAFGAILPNRGFKIAGFIDLVRILEPEHGQRMAAFEELTREIPRGDLISASGLAIPHLADRLHLIHFSETEGAQWVVVVDDLLRGHEAAGLMRIRRDTQSWRLVAEREGVYVFERRQPDVSETSE